MTARTAWLSVVLCTGLTVSPAQAQYFSPTMPGPSCPGPYCNGPWGCPYGAGYGARPPFPPVNGVPPPPFGPMGGGYGGYGGYGGPIPPMAAFPTHPYARGPRDYFMWTEAQQEEITRQRRPPYVP
jgi:hypothetical protein